MYANLKKAGQFVVRKTTQFCESVGGKAAMVGTGAMTLVNQAHAEIPASVATALAAVEDDAAALQAIIIPIVVGVLSLTLVVTLIKRFGSKI